MQVHATTQQLQTHMAGLRHKVHILRVATMHEGMPTCKHVMPSGKQCKALPCRDSDFRLVRPLMLCGSSLSWFPCSCSFSRCPAAGSGVIDWVRHHCMNASETDLTEHYICIPSLSSPTSTAACKPHQLPWTFTSL